MDDMKLPRWILVRVIGDEIMDWFITVTSVPKRYMWCLLISVQPYFFQSTLNSAVPDLGLESVSWYKHCISVNKDNYWLVFFVLNIQNTAKLLTWPLLFYPKLTPELLYSLYPFIVIFPLIFFYYFSAVMGHGDKMWNYSSLLCVFSTLKAGNWDFIVQLPTFLLINSFSFHNPKGY